MRFGRSIRQPLRIMSPTSEGNQLPDNHHYRQSRGRDRNFLQRRFWTTVRDADLTGKVHGIPLRLAGSRTFR
jgi:hypothetical protein